MVTMLSYNTRVTCGKLLENLELTLTPFTIVIGAPQRRKATLLKSLYFAITLHNYYQPDHVFTTLFPGLNNIKLSVKIDNYYIEYDGHSIVKLKGEPPWRYAVYVMPDHPLIVRMMLETAEFIEKFKRQNAAISMLGGLASILATVANRYSRQTLLSRLALCACDVFVQAELHEMCKSWQQALNNVFLGLGAQALAKIADLSPIDISLSDYDIYKKFIETILIKSKSNTIILIENMSYYVSLKSIQRLVKLRVSRGDNIVVVISLTVPPGIARGLEDGKMPKSWIVDTIQAIFEADFDPSVSSLYLFKRLQGEDRIVAERLFP
ncbi:MAG TPA: hypothetical protein EYP08_06505 [Pyrodictiaceae archaeon]|nr:hypothetical protein [Pyrodictiaceae archaeon]HIQ10628.1 hypothetical protein [Pyrodictium sp.]